MTKIANMFSFDEDRDFPYYNGNPKISLIGWTVLLLSIPLSFFAEAIVESALGSKILAALAFCLVMLIPLLYYSKWDYSLIFKKPTKSEIGLAVFMFACYMVYAIFMSTLLGNLGLAGADSSAQDMGIDWARTIGLVFSMMAEELLKFIPLMMLMRLFFKAFGKRRLAFVLSSVIVMIAFGLIHYDGVYHSLASVLLLQGLGTVFELYGYYRTKNIFVPYISHLLTDFISFCLILLGVG